MKVTAPAASRTARELAADVAGIMRGTRTDLRSRREPEVWSPLEYACNLGDALLVNREWILTTRHLDGFVRETMGPERVEFDGWAGQEPGDVARDQQADAEAWKREMVYPWPEPAARSISWVAVHTLDEAHYLDEEFLMVVGGHLLDIRRLLKAD